MKKYLWIDTDLGADCDDVGAIALANILQNQGLTKILGVSHTTSIIYGPACVDAINLYYGNQNIPICATSRVDFCNQNTNIYAEKMAQQFLNRYKCRNEVPDAVYSMREIFNSVEDQSIVLVCIGQLNNIADLLDSPRDEKIPLTGEELVLRKISRLVIMGGLFSEDGKKILFHGNNYELEYNIVCDITSAQRVSKLKIPTYFCDFLLGYEILTGRKLLLENDLTNPVTFAYHYFSNKPRESWDLLALWYAVFQDDKYLKASLPGDVYIDNQGATKFQLNPLGYHHIVHLQTKRECIEKTLDEILNGGIYEKV